MVLGIIAATNPLHVKPITLHTGIAAWFSDALLVVVLSANPIGARVGVLMAGLFMAIPCFVSTAPLNDLFLAGFMCVPFLAAAGLLIVQPIVGFRARLAHLCAWSDTYPLQRRARRFDAAALRNLFLATAVFAVAIAIVKTVSANGLNLPVRWLVGGIGALAIGEMATTGPNFVMAALGINVPPFFQSPYRSVTISEFWGKRWNLPALELLRRCCFAPLAVWCRVRDVRNFRYQRGWSRTHGFFRTWKVENCRGLRCFLSRAASTHRSRTPTRCEAVAARSGESVDADSSGENFANGY